jgi:threonylcarbamoyladenosine tRNA methylthiotransferase MtaB
LKVNLTTNGCVEGQLSSTSLEQFFVKNGVTITDDPRQADLVIFYACGLTEPKEKDSLSTVRKLSGLLKPKAKLLVWGCLTKINPKAVQTVYDGPLIGPLNTKFFEGFLEKPLTSFDSLGWGHSANMLVSSHTSVVSDRNTDVFTDIVYFINRNWRKLWARAHKKRVFFIRVSQGCTGHCTYCSERCAFGETRSQPIETIISEFKEGLEKGYSSFSLMATDLGAYGVDRGYTLVELLKEIIKIGGNRNYKLILNQVNPFYLKKYLSDLEPIFASGKIEELCCPVQSGRNRVLKLMGRRYTAEEWKKCMLEINTKFPHIRLGTQVMVGFPTETEEDFKTTLKLFEYPLFLDFIYIFRFSKRPTVPIARIHEQASEKTKEQRAKRLLRKHARTQIFNAVKKFMSFRFSEVAK